MSTQAWPLIIAAIYYYMGIDNLGNALLQQIIPGAGVTVLLLASLYQARRNRLEEQEEE